MDSSEFEAVAATTKADPHKRLTIKDPGCCGLFVRIYPSGRRAWLVMVRSPDGKQVWRCIGEVSGTPLAKARSAAVELRLRIKRGEKVGKATAVVEPPIGAVHVSAPAPGHVRGLRGRSAYLWSRYQMTEAEYEALYWRQGGCCGLCRRAAKECRHGRLYVDHCHETGAVRGLLCAQCNSMLGFSGDRPRTLRRAAAYLGSGAETVEMTRACLRLQPLLARASVSLVQECQDSEPTLIGMARRLEQRRTRRAHIMRHLEQLPHGSRSRSILLGVAA